MGTSPSASLLVQYNINLSNIGEYTVLPPLIQAGVGGVSGVLADNLIQRGVSVKSIRRWMQVCSRLITAVMFSNRHKCSLRCCTAETCMFTYYNSKQSDIETCHSQGSPLMQISGMLGPAGCLLLAASPAVDDAPVFASALITVAQGLSALTLAGVSVSQLDIAPRHAGAIFGFGNALATFSGLLGTKLTGEILDLTHSWAVVFAVTAGHFVAGSIVWYIWVGDEKLPEDDLQ